MTTASITYQSYIESKPRWKTTQLKRLTHTHFQCTDHHLQIQKQGIQGCKTTWANFRSIPIRGSESQLDIDITFTECIPGGGVLQEFLVGVCRWQNYKPALVYGKWTENHTLTYGIPCEIRPMSIQNMQTKMLFGGTIYKILRVWE